MKEELRFYSSLILIVLLIAIVIVLFAINWDNAVRVAHFVDEVFIRPTIESYVDCYIGYQNINGHCVKIAPSPTFTSAP